MRIAAVAALIFASLIALGCQGNGGAVSVRWRMVDLTTGFEYDPGNYKAADGSCCVVRDPKSNLCLPSNTWVIERVSIVIGDATTGAPIQTPLTPFACSLREKTTPFVLQPGTFAVSLAATNDIGDAMSTPAPVALPPPSVRTISSGDVVNLDVIEIGVNPLPR